jgi:hypothetical protein
MFVSLPRNLAGLAALANRESTRSATATVHVLDQQDGLYRVEVTDGRRLVIVQGPVPEAPPHVELQDDQPDVLAALVAGQDWKAAFALKGGQERPVLLAGGERLTFATGLQTYQTAAVEGRFPEVNRVLPGGAPLFAVLVDALLLAELLKVAAAFLPEGERGVQLLYYGKDKPLGICTRNEQGQVFDALIVPLVIKEAS